MRTRKKEPTLDDLIDGWLVPYHNTTIAQVEKEWVGEKDFRAFYKKYEVTQAQHDEWYEWAVNLLAKHFGWSKKFTRKMFAFEYLNCSPSVKQDETNNTLENEKKVEIL